MDTHSLQPLDYASERTRTTSRQSPERGWQGIARYRRYKPIGIIATALGFFCFTTADFNFWVAANRALSDSAAVR